MSFEQTVNIISAAGNSARWRDESRSAMRQSKMVRYSDSVEVEEALPNLQDLCQ